MPSAQPAHRRSAMAGLASEIPPGRGALSRWSVWPALGRRCLWWDVFPTMASLRHRPTMGGVPRASMGAYFGCGSAATVRDGEQGHWKRAQPNHIEALKTQVEAGVVSLPLLPQASIGSMVKMWPAFMTPTASARNALRAPTIEIEAPDVQTRPNTALRSRQR